MMPGSLESIQYLVSSKEPCGIETPSKDYSSTEVSSVVATCENVEHYKQMGRIDPSQLLHRMLPLDKKHSFWETQPVEQYHDRGKNTEDEGPIAPLRSVAEVRTNPYKLPKHYEWCICDLNCTHTMNEIFNLLSNHYVEDFESMFRYNYSKDFLQWALRPPGYFPSWHIGVRVEATKRLVAFITGIPVNMRLHSMCMPMAEVNFLCIHKKLRSKRLAPLLIKELTRRVHLENIWQAIYTAGIVLPTPLVTCQYWHRPLNSKKLIKVGFSQLGLGMTMGRTIKHYRLPQKTFTPGFRAMERRDISAVARLLQQYLQQFVVAPELSEADVEHWLVPLNNVVNTYVIEDVESHNITDVCSFYTLPSTVLGDQRHTALKAAYLFYNVTTKTPLSQLVNDLLIVAKQSEYDVFNVLDIMQNQSFLQELKFKLGDGHLQYYLYNYRLKEPLSPGDLGVILL
ncbi:hypothetical protein GOP47_0019234 [Adiantum capillus-veneris]|uniref:Glycylpeptide N-tetradecanoyltransferase n=1 Tax=Adiantum capillus-veneris TaxID=13818 RepID=A0A9D4ZAG5_ADICA|nr:hypothetical protein GOP47_0019234 [Adiantum capillus-veneris]